MLFAIWAETPHRPTRDVDLLGYGAIDLRRLEREFRDIVTYEVEPDGIKFKPGTVKAEQIRNGQAYEGVRVTMKADLAGAVISVQVDVGFGDSTAPGLVEEQLPTLLEFPPPRLRAYRPETVVAEKFEAMVKLGIANTRMKDFYDLYVISRSMTFERATLSNAIQATFERRQTAFPVSVPTALTDAFATDAAKLAQWRSFVDRSGGDAARLSLPDVIAGIREFLLPLVDVAHDATIWTPASGWHRPSSRGPS